MSSDGLQNLTEDQLSAMVPPEPHDRFDQELVGGFAQHGGAWSGTASELLAAVTARVDIGNNFWPQSPRAVYTHLESHRQTLHSLGVAVSLPNGVPRMISLRPCRDEQHARELPGACEINETFSQDIPIAQPDVDRDNPESISNNAAEELFAMLRKSPTLESSGPGTVARLAAAPTLLWTAFKRAFR